MFHLDTAVLEGNSGGVKMLMGATFSSLWYCWVVWWGGGECPAEDGVEACSAQLYKTNHPGDFCF